MDTFHQCMYSYDMNCMNCTSMKHNLAKYVAVAFISLTFFFLLVVIFNFNGASPLLKAFISVCQGLASPINTRASLSQVKNRTYIKAFVRFLGSVYGIWNLDFFRTVIPPICLNITPIQALALDYAVALYPLLLVVVTYILISLHSRDVRIVVWMWKPFHTIFSSIKKKWEVQGSVINAFATFLLLSYVKILDVSFDLLVYTEVHILNKTGHTYSRNVLYFDASVEYLSNEHLPYAITGMFVVVFVVIMPLLFLIIYPMRWFQKCLNACHIQRQSIDMFVNCYQGYYKDGTDGTRDCRPFSVAFFLMQIFVFVMFGFARNIYCYPISAVFLIVMALVTLFVQPYKEQFKLYSLLDTFMLLNLACVLVMVTGADEADIKAIFISEFFYIVTGIIGFIPLIYLLALSLWWFLLKKKFGKKCFGKLRSCFQANVEAEGSEEQGDLPDRVQNSAAEASPPLFVQEAQKNNTSKEAKYGLAVLL